MKPTRFQPALTEHCSRVDRKDLGKGKEGVEVGNDLHYTDKGYEVFSERLAKASIELIRQTRGKE